MLPFLYPLKTPKNIGFLIFSGDKKWKTPQKSVKLGEDVSISDEFVSVSHLGQ